MAQKIKQKLTNGRYFDQLTFINLIFGANLIFVGFFDREMCTI
jgi:hypothetical protein